MGEQLDPSDPTASGTGQRGADGETGQRGADGETARRGAGGETARRGADDVVTTGWPIPKRRWKRGDLNLAFRIVASVIIPTFRFASDYHWHGPNRLPSEGAFIVAPNHFTEVDPLVVGTAVYLHRRQPRYLAKASLFRIPVVGRLMYGMGNIPVDRSGRSREHDPLTGGNSLVSGGGGIIVYPEGTLTRDPDLWPMRGKTGAVRMALENDVPLIPLAHWGTQGIMGRYSKRIKLFPRTRVDVKIGDPMDLSKYRGRPLDQAMLLEATAELMARITELLEDLRQETAPANRWDPAANDQKETGRFE